MSILDKFILNTKPINLFQSGEFKLASGAKSDFKIEMDALTENDWATLALIAVAYVLPPFYAVHGVPRGGTPFADALQKYVSPKGGYRVICDDVLTTGESMEKYRDTLVPKAPLGDHGIVVFARGKPPWWVTPLFKAGWL